MISRPTETPAFPGVDDVRRGVAFALASLRRHLLLAFASVAVTVLLVSAMLATLPYTWRVRTVVLAQRNPAIGQTVNPGRRGAPDLPPPTRGGWDVMHAADTLLEIVQRSGALDTWNNRSLATSFKDRVMRHLRRRPITREDQEDALAVMLDRKLDVEPSDETLELSLDWPDREGAERIVRTASALFVEKREHEELAAVESTTRILEQHAAEVTQELKNARKFRTAARADSLHALEERRVSLEQQIEDARLEKEAVSASFKMRFATLVEPLAGKKPLKPDFALALLGALLGGLLAGIAAAVHADLRCKRIFHSWQASAVTGLPALGTIALSRHDGAGTGAQTRVPIARSTLGLVLGLDVAAAAVLWFAGGNPIAGVLPAIGFAALCAVATQPLRNTVAALLFVWLAFPLRTDAEAAVSLPLHQLNDFFVDNIGMTIGVDAIKVSGFEVTVLFLLGLIVFRRATKRRIDRQGQVATAAVLGDFALLWFAVVAYCSLNGAGNGGQMAVIIWHARPLVAYALLFFVYQEAFRGPDDATLLGRIVVASAVAKGITCILLEIFVMRQMAQYKPLEYATNHHDSITFAVATAILFASVTERPSRKRVVGALGWFAVIAMGMLINNRRLVWIDCALAVATIVLMSPWRPWKRALVRTVVVALPIAVVYLSAGWNSTSAVFKPAAMLRSIADSKTDRSTLDRDAENLNLLLSMRERPFLGRGFGHEYTEYWQADDISKAFPMYKSIPHNSILGLLLFCGVLGFTGLSLILGASVYLAARSYQRTRNALHRAAALSAIAVVLVVMLQEYGDMGLISLQARVLLPLAFVLSGKLAVATGAWPARKKAAARPAFAAQKAPSLV